MKNPNRNLKIRKGIIRFFTNIFENIEQQVTISGSKLKRIKYKNLKQNRKSLYSRNFQT